MAGTWNARLGNLWGGFRVGSNKALLLVSPGDFHISDAGKIDLSARYDPPGSGWRALLAALGTLIIVVLLAQAMGTCVGPGWLLWYILFIYIRRRQVTIDLEKSESVVVDAASRRLGFLTEFLGEKRWVAFEIKENFETAVQGVSTTITAPISEGKIARRLRAATIFVFVTLGLFAVLIFLSIFVYMLYGSRGRR
ncbi:MAG: hypothetical protein AABM67_14700 [Acidobacteriota bacterium]